MNLFSTRRSLRLALRTTALFASAAGVALATTALPGTQAAVIQFCKLNGLGGPATQGIVVSLTSPAVGSVTVPAMTVPTGEAGRSIVDRVTILGLAGAEITATLNGESIHTRPTPG